MLLQTAFAVAQVILPLSSVDVAIGKDSDALPMALVFFPLPCVLASDGADLHADPVSHVIEPTALVDVAVALNGQLALLAHLILVPKPSIRRIVTCLIKSTMTLPLSLEHGSFVEVLILKVNQSLVLFMAGMQVRNLRVRVKPVVEQSGLCKFEQEAPLELGV